MQTMRKIIENEESLLTQIRALPYQSEITQALSQEQIDKTIEL